MNNKEIIIWLLQGDISIQYQVHYDGESWGLEGVHPIHYLKEDTTIIKTHSVNRIMVENFPGVLNIGAYILELDL